MASINFTEFKKPTNSSAASSPYLYVDINFDLALDKNPYTLKGSDINKNRDLKISSDFAAIANSIFNILNTSPGERILLPQFGTNLKGELFEPVTQPRAAMIGRIIVQAIEKWEPRVIIQNVNVVGYKDDQTYAVEIRYSVPSLNNRQNTISTILSQEGFIESNI